MTPLSIILIFIIILLLIGYFYWAYLTMTGMAKMVSSAYGERYPKSKGDAWSVEFVLIVSVMGVSVMFLFFTPQIEIFYFQIVLILALLVLQARLIFNPNPIQFGHYKKLGNALAGGDLKDVVYNKFNAYEIVIETFAKNLRQSSLRLLYRHLESEKISKEATLYTIEKQSLEFKSQVEQLTIDNTTASQNLKNKYYLLFAVVYFFIIVSSIVCLYGAVQHEVVNVKGIELETAFVDTTYFVFSAVSTIGYGDFQPKDLPSKVLTITLVFPILLLVYVVISNIGGYVDYKVANQFSGYIGFYRRRIEQLAKLENIVKNNQIENSPSELAHIFKDLEKDESLFRNFKNKK